MKSRFNFKNRVIWHVSAEVNMLSLNRLLIDHLICQRAELDLFGSLNTYCSEGKCPCKVNSTGNVRDCYKVKGNK